MDKDLDAILALVLQPVEYPILDLGCLESALYRRYESHGRFVGVDWRAPDRSDVVPREFVRGDVCDVALDGAFRTVFAVSSVEHFGLGFYGDPVRPGADLRVMLRVRDEWLEPGGVFYVSFPVGDRRLRTDHFRVYDVRMMDEMFLGWRVEAESYYMRPKFGWLMGSFRLRLV